MNHPSRDAASEIDKHWYGWGSPIGLGLFVLSLCLSLAAALAAARL